MLKVSYINCWIYSLSIQVAPRRTSISDASRSLGWAAVRASTLTAKEPGPAVPPAAPDAAFGAHCRRGIHQQSHNGVCRPAPAVPVHGRSRLAALRPVLLLFFRCQLFIYAISTQAFSEMDTASASLAVSTVATA